MKTVSMTELGKSFGVKAPAGRAERVKKCRKCGADMVHLDGTNVYICPGKDGKSCENVFYTKF